MTMRTVGSMVYQAPVYTKQIAMSDGKIKAHVLCLFNGNSVRCCTTNYHCSALEQTHELGKAGYFTKKNTLRYITVRMLWYSAPHQSSTTTILR